MILFILVLMALAILAKAHTSATKIDCNNNLNALVKEKLNINFATYEYLYSFEIEERYILVSGDNYIYNNSNEVAGHTMQCNFCGDITLQPHNFIPSGRGGIDVVYVHIIQ